MPSDYTIRTRFRNERVQRLMYSIYGSPLNEGGSVTSRDWESLLSRRNGYRTRETYSGDVGGDFKKLTFSDLHRNTHVDIASQSTAGSVPAYHYVGHVHAMGGSPSIWEIPYSFGSLTMSDQELMANGTRFIAEASPTAPKAGLTTAIVELKREGLPRLSSEVLTSLQRGKRRSEAIKGSGSDFLNWQFGWVPLVSDIRRLADSIMNAESLLASLYRDNGKVVRRKRGSSTHERVLSEESRTEVAYGWPTMVSSMYAGYPPSRFEVTKVTRTLWFSGAFMYHIPENVTSLGKLQRLAAEARYLYGIGFSPEDVWNLVPWTWLSDWVFNAGDVLSNISDQLFGHQVLKYGYVMCHTRKEISSEMTIPLYNGYVHKPSALRIYDVKQRLSATPFGFGLSWSGFTPGQLAILSALGLSRGR